MSAYENYKEQYNALWQGRILKTCLLAALLVAVFEVVFFFVITALDLRTQPTGVYVTRFILVPIGVIVCACIVCAWAVHGRKLAPDLKSLVALLCMVIICCAIATVHNIFTATMSCFFIPLAISAVFGKKWISNVVGCSCVCGELFALFWAWKNLRGENPYFLPDSMLLFIIFGVVWYVALLLMTNEWEKQKVLECIQEEKSLLQEAVCRDKLTGLYNLLGLQLFVDELQSKNRQKRRKAAVVFVDVDNFKQVNDGFGHEAGNRVLIRLAEQLREQFPNDVCLARYGGDEFVILLPGSTPEECYPLVDALRHTVENEAQEALHGGNISISCGIAPYDLFTPILQAINCSDQAMYRAKEEGKNRTVLA